MYSFDVFFIHLSIHLFTGVFVFYLSILLFVHVFVSPFICLFIYLWRPSAALMIMATNQWTWRPWPWPGQQGHQTPNPDQIRQLRARVQRDVAEEFEESMTSVASLARAEAFQTAAELVCLKEQEEQAAVASTWTRFSSSYRGAS